MPPAYWHRELINIGQTPSYKSNRIVVDLLGFYFLVGQDIGFLKKISKELSGLGIEFAIVVEGRIVKALNIVNVSEKILFYESIQQAL